MANLYAIERGKALGGAPKTRPLPKFSVVEMKEVPDPSISSIYGTLFEELYKLDGTKAMRIEFDSESQGAGARTSLKKRAGNAGCKFRANRGGAGNLVWFMWVERPENRATGNGSAPKRL